MALAWHVAMLTRQHKLPALDTLLQPVSGSRGGQSPQQMRIAAGILADAYGFKTRWVAN